MLAVSAVAWIVPAAIFFTAPFSDPDFHSFLDQNFDRGYLPALVILALTAFVWLGGTHALPDGQGK